MLNPLVNGIGGSSGSVTKDTATHTIRIPLPLGKPPPDLKENAACEVDMEPGKWQKFRVLRNGLDKGAGVWKLYVRTEAAEVLA